jgi:transcriptional regulator with XRE-family HTH domain
MKTQYQMMIEDPRMRRLLSVETLVAEASEVIAKLMAEQGISKADLARRLDKSRAWVTQLLSGRTNVTVRTLAEVAFVLDAELKLRAQPPRWSAAMKPLSGGPQDTFKSAKFTLELPRGSSAVFELRSAIGSDDDSSVNAENGGSEFAA